jgi:hypothetical protein
MNAKIRPLPAFLTAAVVMLISLLSPVLAGAGMSAGPAAANEIDNWQVAHHFVGTWRLVDFKATTGTGAVVHPFGVDAGGVATWTDEGRMTASLWKANRQPFASNDQQLGTPDEYTAAGKSWISYLGTYTVDADAGTISHHVEQSYYPNWNNTVQTRYYAFSNHFNTLTLSTPPIPFGGTTIVGALIWQRIG